MLEVLLREAEDSEALGLLNEDQCAVQFCIGNVRCGGSSFIAMPYGYEAARLRWRGPCGSYSPELTVDFSDAGLVIALLRFGNNFAVCLPSDEAVAV